MNDFFVQIKQNINNIVLSYVYSSLNIEQKKKSFIYDFIDNWTSGLVHMSVIIVKSGNLSALV